MVDLYISLSASILSIKVVSVTTDKNTKLDLSRVKFLFIYFWTPPIKYWREGVWVWVLSSNVDLLLTNMWESLNFPSVGGGDFIKLDAIRLSRVCKSQHSWVEHIMNTGNKDMVNNIKLLSTRHSANRCLSAQALERNMAQEKSKTCYFSI